MIKYVKVDIPDCCEYLEVFMEDRQNVVHQRFPISGITKQNVTHSYIEIRSLVQHYLPQYLL